ncbi:alpha/beta fold hydrolase [Mycobacterium hubeiense]|uniref:alpha/beta fold hydrolase n=1 Tax=Mycobacterium hubeiense TaxID=1867256 RepID=UPI000C7F6154|nr:alpha/beta hydrolase [Mycobacterium sp. QGD 101]
MTAVWLANIGVLLAVALGACAIVAGGAAWVAGEPFHGLTRLGDDAYLYDQIGAGLSAFLDMIRPATVCDPAKLPDAYEVGNGLYTNMFTVRDAAAGAQSAVPQRLRSVRTPTLIITGDCNYVPWAPTAEHGVTLPRSTLVCVGDAGHSVELDQPDLYRRLVESFVRDEPLPIPATAPTRPCHP